MKMFVDLRRGLFKRAVALHRRCRRWDWYADIDDIQHTLRRYRRVRGQWPNLIQPATIGEWVQRKKLWERDPRLPQLADKLTMREWIAGRVGTELLPQLYAVYERADDLRLADLPPAFVLKPTHGSGWVEVVQDSSRCDETALRQTAAYWLTQNYADHSREWPYRHVVPRLMVEELFDDGSGEAPTDYKFLCFNGSVRAIQVHTGRFTDHRRALYDPHWNYLGWTVPDWLPETPLPVPPQLAEMTAVAEQLSREFVMLRVDLYAGRGWIAVGELTFYPSNGFDAVSDQTFEVELGRYWTAAERERPV